MDLSAQICQKNLREYLESKGHKFKKSMTLCPFHNDNNESMNVNEKNGGWVWYCHGCKEGGNIIHYVMKKDGQEKKDALRQLSQHFGLETGLSQNKKIIATYDYLDENGKLLFQKVRYLPKSFAVRRKKNGKWVYNINGIRHVLYNLPNIIAAKGIWIVEGEKDAETLIDLNITATTPPFGVESWKPEYDEYFKSKEVVICLDKGYEHIARSCASKLVCVAKQVKVISLPGLEKNEDVTEWFKKLGEEAEASLSNEEKIRRLMKVYNATPVFELKLSQNQASDDTLSVDNDFLNLYIDSISRYTDAPYIFILFSGIALLSGVLNKFYFKYPRRTHLNLYILLLAPSTYYRKSTCTDLVGDYLDECNPELRLPESFTVEALYEIMKKYPKGLIIWPELIQVKEFQMAKEYNRGLLAFLTDIYDFKKKWHRWTVGKGEIVVEEPVISILAAGITNWFTNNLQAIDFQGGLWTRFLFIPAPIMERNYSPPRPFILDHAINRSLSALNDLEGGEVDLSRIMPLMQEWGARHQEETMRLETQILSAVYQRLEVMLLKLAALLQLSNNQSTVITPESFREAVKIIEHLKSQLPAFFEDEIQFGEHEKAVGTILKYLRKKGKALKKEILQGTRVRKKIADPALQQLEDEEKIRSEGIPAPPRGGRAGRIYIYISED